MHPGVQRYRSDETAPAQPVASQSDWEDYKNFFMKEEAARLEDDRRKPYLAARWPHAQIIVNPEAARPHGIERGDFVEVVNDEVFVQTREPIGVRCDDLTFSNLRATGHIKVTEGQFTAVAIASDEIRVGVAKAIFVGGKSWANAVIHSVSDPISGNYRYKLGRGALRKIGMSPYKHSFAQTSLKARDIV